MATNNDPMNTSNSQPYNTNDLPPPYSAVVGNPQYGFVVPSGEQFPAAAGGVFPQPKQFTPIGVYPHPTSAQPQNDVPPPLPGMSPPIDVVMPSEVGSLPTTVTCYNCGKVVVTKVTYTASWHTHFVASTICLITMVCSVCCLGLIPYCFDTFKDAEHYCPNCNTFIGKRGKC